MFLFFTAMIWLSFFLSGVCGQAKIFRAARTSPLPPLLPNPSYAPAKYEGGIESAAKKYFLGSTPPPTVNAINGELLAGFFQGGQPYNYQLYRDPNVYLVCEADKVAPLSPEAFLLLEAIKNRGDRLETYRHELDWGLSLKEGSRVSVTIPGARLHQARAVVRYKGKKGSISGTFFGVEILEQSHRAARVGTKDSDGTFQDQRYFTCDDGSGIFVSLGQISPTTDTQHVQGTHEAQGKGLKPTKERSARPSPRYPRRIAKPAFLKETARGETPSGSPQHAVLVPKDESDLSQQAKAERVAASPYLSELMRELQTSQLKKDKMDKVDDIAIDEAQVNPEENVGQQEPEHRGRLQNENTASERSQGQQESAPAAPQREEYKTYEEEQKLQDVRNNDQHPTHTYEEVKDYLNPPVLPPRMPTNRNLENEEVNDYQGHPAGSNPRSETTIIPASLMNQLSLSGDWIPQQHDLELHHNNFAATPAQDHTHTLRSDFHHHMLNHDVSRPQGHDNNLSYAQNDVRPHRAEHDYFHSKQPVNDSTPSWRHVPEQEPPPDVYDHNDAFHAYPYLKSDFQGRIDNTQLYSDDTHSMQPGYVSSHVSVTGAGFERGSHPIHREQSTNQDHIHSEMGSASALPYQTNSSSASYNLAEGSLVQLPGVSGTAKYGTIKWIGHVPQVPEEIAGIEMDEPMPGCSDGTFETTGEKFFDCPHGKGMFYPLKNLKPDPRYVTVERQDDNSFELLFQQNNYLACQNEGLRAEKEKLIEEHQALIEDLTASLQADNQNKDEEIQRLRLALDQQQQFDTKKPPSSEESSWNIPRAEIHSIPKKKISSGAWGMVYSAKFRGKDVAIKIVHREILHKSTIDLLKREVIIMSRVQHPNLVRFIAAVWDDAVERQVDAPIIISELMDMNLRAAYEQNIDFSSSLTSIFCDIAYALHYLHCQYIIHRDVSAPNVLLKFTPSRSIRAKVSDFGSANTVLRSRTTGPGAAMYAAPEVFATAGITAQFQPPKQTPKVDVYSYGVLLLEVVAKEMPSQETSYTMLQKIRKEWNMMYELIVHCTKQSPSDRPTMADVLNKLNSTPTNIIVYTTC